jgi:hypothetical protein
MSTRNPKLARLHAHTRQKRATTRQRHRKRDSLGLGANTPEQDWHEAELAAHYPVGLFGPQNGLSLAQAILANRLWDRATRRKPLRDLKRLSLRLNGIIVAVRSGRAGNSAFGRSLHGHRGGNAMRDHGARILKANREQRRQQQAWDTQMAPQTSLDEQIAQWQQEQWQPKNFLAW